MNRIITKLSMLLILILVSITGIANAELHDTENAGGSFAASYLDLELRNTDNSPLTDPLFDEGSLKLEQALKKSVRLVNTGTQAVYYTPEFKKTGGDDAVCDTLEITAEVDGAEFYEGPLSSFNTGEDSQVLSGTFDEWEFELVNNDPSVELQGMQCDFDLTFTGYSDASLTGFSDVESTANHVRSSYEAALIAQHNPENHTFTFTLSKLDNFTAFTYSLDYDTDTIADHVEGDIVLQHDTQKIENILLGTCSNTTCTYHANPHNFILSVGLIDIDGGTQIITEQL